mmetsp:Transcript_15707/g.38896  ORF Transcript_15707/g.38896 Transcript_15707/m.38896 type:complete len:399 (-) Transcript_15707:2591-3787(-)
MVDLPAPFGPRSPKHSPRCTPNVTPFRAHFSLPFASLKHFVMRFAVRSSVCSCSPPPPGRLPSRTRASSATTSASRPSPASTSAATFLPRTSRLFATRRPCFSCSPTSSEVSTTSSCATADVFPPPAFFPVVLQISSNAQRSRRSPNPPRKAAHTDQCQVCTTSVPLSHEGCRMAPISFASRFSQRPSSLPTLFFWILITSSTGVSSSSNSAKWSGSRPPQNKATSADVPCFWRFSSSSSWWLSASVTRSCVPSLFGSDTTCSASTPARNSAFKGSFTVNFDFFFLPSASSPCSCCPSDSSASATTLSKASSRSRASASFLTLSLSQPSGHCSTWSRFSSFLPFTRSSRYFFASCRASSTSSGPPASLPPFSPPRPRRLATIRPRSISFHSTPFCRSA